MRAPVATTALQAHRVTTHALEGAYIYELLKVTGFLRINLFSLAGTTALPTRAATRLALVATTAPPAQRPTKPALLDATALRGSTRLLTAMLAFHALQRYGMATHDVLDTCWAFADFSR